MFLLLRESMTNKNGKYSIDKYLTLYYIVKRKGTYFKKRVKHRESPLYIKC